MISSNIGSDILRSLDYNVIDDTVNTAECQQSAAVDRQIVINEGCYEKVKQSSVTKKLTPPFLKNKSENVELYEVLN